MRVLLAHDCSDTVGTLRSIVEKTSHDIVTAKAGHEVHDFVSSSTLRPGIIFLNMDLPGLDCLDFCQSIQSNMENSFVYLIALTARNKSEYLLNVLRNGAHDYIVLPLDHAVVEARLLVGTRLCEIDNRLRKLAMSDSQTGLLNRRFFLQKLSQELGRCRRDQQPASLICIDLDHLKKINDQYGHPAGDRYLSHIADQLRAMIQNQNFLISRFGGDEFLLFCPGLFESEASVFAERIRTWLLENPFMASPDQSIPVSISIGVAGCTLGELRQSELMKHGDRALYAAKKSGRNCVVSFDSIPKESVTQKSEENGIGAGIGLEN